MCDLLTMIDLTVTEDVNDVWNDSTRRREKTGKKHRKHRTTTCTRIAKTQFTIIAMATRYL